MAIDLYGIRMGLCMLGKMKVYNNKTFPTNRMSLPDQCKNKSLEIFKKLLKSLCLCIVNFLIACVYIKCILNNLNLNNNVYLYYMKCLYLVLG